MIQTKFLKMNPPRRANQNFYNHREQMRTPVPPGNIQYMSQYQQQPQISNRPPHVPNVGNVPGAPAANVGAPGSFHIDMTPTELSGPDSLDYSTPIHFSYLFSNLHNPELDEEFDIGNLGIDLQTTKPLLPNISYAGSDNPLVNFGQFPVPHSYPNDESNMKAIDRISQFSDESLLFIFYIHARDILQKSAYDELTNRGYFFDPTKKVWSNSAKLVFDINKWKFVTPDQSGYVPTSA